jgi:hypothetical protein
MPAPTLSMAAIAKYTNTSVADLYMEESISGSTSQRMGGDDGRGYERSLSARRGMSSYDSTGRPGVPGMYGGLGPAASVDSLTIDTEAGTPGGGLNVQSPPFFPRPGLGGAPMPGNRSSSLSSGGLGASAMSASSSAGGSGSGSGGGGMGVLSVGKVRLG